MEKSRRRKGAVVAIIAAIAASMVAIRHRPAETPRAPTASAAGAAAVANAPAQPAVAALMALPELKAWSDAIEKKSAGRAHGAVVAGDVSQARTVNGKTYQAYTFVESDPDAAHFWQGFYVTPTGDSILVDDPANDGVMTVDEWRQKEHPLDRIK